MVAVTPMAAARPTAMRVIDCPGVHLELESEVVGPGVAQGIGHDDFVVAVVLDLVAEAVGNLLAALIDLDGSLFG